MSGVKPETKQRRKGSGSVYFDERRNRHIATMEIGWTARGTRRRITASGTTETKALAALKAKEREVLLSGAPQEGVRAGATVKAWADAWLPRQERTLRPAAYNATRSGLTHWIIPTIGHKRLDRLSPGDVRSVALAIEDAGRATSTARRVHAELLRMLSDAFADGHAVPERSRGVKLDRAKGRKRITRGRTSMSPADVAAVLTTIDAREDRARWVLALVLGIRPAEARGLTWECVNFERGVIVIEWQMKALPYKVPRDRASGFRVPREFDAVRLHDAYHLVRPKTDAGWRVVPLTTSATEALKAWRDVAPANPYGLVFPNDEGRALDDKRDREAWHTILALAGLPPRDLYIARHTAASHLSASGAASADVTSVMGHASLLSTEAYLHGEVERSRAALESAEASMRKG